MNELLKELYQEIILDHGREPRNFGECENYNKSADGHNPLCGDKVHVTLIVDANKIIKDIKFSGVGCAISIASASLMTEVLKNKSNSLNLIDLYPLLKAEKDIKYWVHPTDQHPNEKVHEILADTLFHLFKKNQINSRGETVSQKQILAATTYR